MADAKNSTTDVLKRTVSVEIPVALYSNLAHIAGARRDTTTNLIPRILREYVIDNLQVKGAKR